MGWRGFVAVASVFLLIADVPSLYFDLNGRKLVASESVNNPAPAQVLPLPNPVPGGQILAPKMSGNDKSSINSPGLIKDNTNSSTTSPNVTVLMSPHTLDQTHNKSTNDKKPGTPIEPNPPKGKVIDKKSSPPEGKEIEKKPGPPPEGNEIDKKPIPHPAKDIDKTPISPTGAVNCDAKEKKCQIQNTFTGCIVNFGSGSEKLEILIQNDGQETLKVDITFPTSAVDNKKDVIVAKHQTTKVNISDAFGKASKIVLSTGSKKCEIVIGSPLPEGNPFFHVPDTKELLTPVNGAYFLIITVVTFGGVWACCTFTKRRRHGSVPYQELEMASAETVTGAYPETAEGWDQGWDDDWDEENSVKSPVRPHTGNISANGLNSRPANRDGWENDWDD
ncbi:hypothetical protein SAY87_014777 [Trapa incisa]|uniref:DUF7356 domain-containing protein n=1 Tax=Trapa incisa TaxID=236973 RepID=A0AAN7JDK7_9MYRT|nr:hypothetical protein SAY87_014777 [Trapa incisa]